MIRTGLFVLMVAATSPSAGACELPADPTTHYAEVRNEERQLTRQALARADSVFVATVTSIEHEAETPDPSERESRVVVQITEMLKGSQENEPTVLRARLHHVVTGCFGNEAFRDDQVEVGEDYLLFVERGKIAVATPSLADARRLGLNGQREVVLQALADEAHAVPGSPAAAR